LHELIEVVETCDVRGTIAHDEVGLLARKVTDYFTGCLG